jgi:hypothetical protein
MAFKDGEITVVEVPFLGNVPGKIGLTPQDQIDMAGVGKKQQFNVNFQFAKIEPARSQPVAC